MVTLSVTLGDLNPQTTQISKFCIAYHIFIADEHRDFKFGVRVDYRKSQPVDNKLPERDVVTYSNPFLILVPIKYLWNGLN